MYEDTMMLIEEARAKEAKAAYKANKERMTAVSEEADKQAIWDKLLSLNEGADDFANFKQKVTDAYVVEALTILVDNCLNPVLVREDYHQKLVRQLVTNFVKEEGSSRLLRKFKGTSYLMSEMAYAIETTVQNIIENSKENDVTKIDKKHKDDFYTKLEKVDVESAIDKITTRVREQQNDFINSNMKEKAQLADALDKTNKKVENTKVKLTEKHNSEKAQEAADKVEESYIELGKRNIVDIRESKSKNIFECMVYNLSKSALVNESAGQVFVKDSKLDMDKIVEHCETICTFVTTLDSLKIINVDEAYIEKMLADMKG